MKKRIFYGWWIVWVCFFVGLFGSGTITYGFTSFIQPLVREFGWSYAQVSLATSMRAMAVSIATPFVGWFIDRWGARKLMLSGSIISCLGLLLLLQMQSLAVFYMAFVIIGIGAATAISNATIPTVANWFRKHIGIATGIAISGAGAAGLLLPLITYIIETYGWRSAILAIMLSILIIVIPSTFLLRHRPEDYGLMPDGEPAVERTPPNITSVIKLNEPDFDLKQALSGRAFWQVAIAIMCFLFVSSAVSAHVMPYLDTIGMDRYTSSFVASAILIVSMVGRIGLGWFSDRFNKKILTVVAFVIISVSMFCFACAATFGYWLVIPFFILFGIGSGGVFSLGGVLTSLLFGRKHFGSIYGLIGGIAGIGMLTGPPLAGWIYDSWGTYQWFWLVLAAVAVAGAMIVLTISPPSIESKHAICSKSDLCV